MSGATTEESSGHSESMKKGRSDSSTMYDPASSEIGVCARVAIPYNTCAAPSRPPSGKVLKRGHDKDAHRALDCMGL